MPFSFQKCIFKRIRCTLSVSHYGWRPIRVFLIPEMHIWNNSRKYSTLIQLLKWYVTFACQIFSKIYLRNNLIKHTAAWSHSHCCFSLQIFTKNPFINNSLFHSKSPILWFVTPKGAKEITISGKDHLFQDALPTLILFFI